MSCDIVISESKLHPMYTIRKYLNGSTVLLDVIINESYPATCFFDDDIDNTKVNKIKKTFLEQFDEKDFVFIAMYGRTAYVDTPFNCTPIRLSDEYQISYRNFMIQHKQRQGLIVLYKDHGLQNLVKFSKGFGEFATHEFNE